MNKIPNLGLEPGHLSASYKTDTLNLADFGIAKVMHGKFAQVFF